MEDVPFQRVQDCKRKKEEFTVPRKENAGNANHPRILDRNSVKVTIYVLSIMITSQHLQAECHRYLGIGRLLCTAPRT